MGKQITKKVPASFVIIVLIIAVLLFDVSCSKSARPPQTGDKVPVGTGIVYTRVGADSVIISASRSGYALDLDKDGHSDIQFITYGGKCGDNMMGPQVTQTYLSIHGYATSTDGIDFASVLDSAAVINPGSLWANNQFLLRGAITPGYIRCMIAFGEWFDVSDRYLGVKFSKGVDTLYGWLRLSSSYGIMSASNHGRMIVIGEIKLKDYAFNSNPGQPILAGQMK